MRALDRACAQCTLLNFNSAIHVPSVDCLDTNEENRPFVFPACGHIFAYNKSLENRSCPLCRTSGCFVPMAFEFEPMLGSGIPTHIFNPCGHAASYETCSKWSKTRVYPRDITVPNTVSICPFCSRELSSTKPYSKIVLHTESENDWISSHEQLIHEMGEQLSNSSHDMSTCSPSELKQRAEAMYTRTVARCGPNYLLSPSQLYEIMESQHSIFKKNRSTFLLDPLDILSKFGSSYFPKYITHQRKR